MIGKMIVFVAFVILLSGCSSKSYIFGEENGFCEECGYQYKGICANPMDIYNNAEIIADKPSTCAKTKSKRKGDRK